MAWCRQATSHYLSQCWSRSLPPHDVTRPQWVNCTRIPPPVYACVVQTGVGTGPCMVGVSLWLANSNIYKTGISLVPRYPMLWVRPCWYIKRDRYCLNWITVRQNYTWKIYICMYSGKGCEVVIGTLWNEFDNNLWKNMTVFLCGNWRIVV